MKKNATKNSKTRSKRKSNSVQDAVIKPSSKTTNSSAYENVASAIGGLNPGEKQKTPSAFDRGKPSVSADGSFRMRISTALLICIPLGLFIGMWNAAVVFFLIFGWYLEDAQGRKIF